MQVIQRSTSDSWKCNILTIDLVQTLMEWTDRVSFYDTALEPWCDWIAVLCVGVKINLINFHDSSSRHTFHWTSWREFLLLHASGTWGPCVLLWGNWYEESGDPRVLLSIYGLSTTGVSNPPSICIQSTRQHATATALQNIPTLWMKMNKQRFHSHSQKIKRWTLRLLLHQSALC